MRALLYSNLSVLGEWHPSEESDGGLSQNLTAVLWGHPWEAILAGCLVGAIMTLILNRYEWKHAEEIAKTQPGFRAAFSTNRYFIFRLVIVVSAFGTLAALCYALGLSAGVAGYALLFPLFLGYRVNNHIYTLRKKHYAAALEAAGGPAGPIGPSRAQKAWHAVLLIASFAFLLPISVYAVRAAQQMAELDLLLQPAHGSELTSDQATDLEKRLSQDPEDLRARAQLVGYYGTLRAKGDSSEAATRLRYHLLWWIERHPESYVGIAGDFSPKRNGGDTAPLLEAERLWRKQIDLHPKNAKVLSNAAAFFYSSKDDLPQAIELMKRCTVLEPRKEEWTTELQHLQAVKLTESSR